MSERGQSEKSKDGVKCEREKERKKERKKQETESHREREGELFPFFGPGSASSTVHFLSVGKVKVGGLLPSPLITLNDSNGPKTYL